MGDTFTSTDEKAFDLATQVIKQIITLSTIILASSAMIAKEFLSDHQLNLIFLTCAWVSLLLSIVAGIWALLQITTELIKDACDGPPSIKTPKITEAVMAQIGLFILALGILVGHAIKSIF